MKKERRLLAIGILLMTGAIFLRERNYTIISADLRDFIEGIGSAFVIAAYIKLKRKQNVCDKNIETP